jgi:hypothetical protein
MPARSNVAPPRVITLLLVGLAACSSTSNGASASTSGSPDPSSQADGGAVALPNADGGTSTQTQTDGGAGAEAATPPPIPVGATHLTCTNDSGDAARIRSAIAANAAVALSGTCNLGSTTLTLPANEFLAGPATLDYSGTGYAVAGSASGDTVSQLTFDGGGVELSSGTDQAGWSVVFDTFQNITSGSDGIHVDNILGKGAASTLSHNTFKNIWSGGYPNFPSGKDASSCGQDDCIYGGGIFWHMGLDNTTIDDNVMDEIAFDGIKGFWDGFLGNTGPYEGHNVVISNNVITNTHRIGIEVQASGQGNCPGGCNFSNVPTDGTVIKNNFVTKPAFTNNYFALSLMVGGTNAQLINNTGNNDVATCYSRAGIGLENSVDEGSLVQGNVVGSVAQSCYQNGWADFVACGYNSGNTTYQNNIMCGPGAAAQASIKSGADPQDNQTAVETADLWTNDCPAGTNISTSAIAVTFTSADNQNLSSGGNGTWNVSLTSNLSIKYVRFYVDGASSPKVTQEIQDLNTAFTTDHAWHYHATFDTSWLSSGAHVIAAIATDVSGATQNVSQSWTR